MRKTWLVAIFIALISFVVSANAGTLAELEKNARSGKIDAQVELGYRYLYGLGLKKDIYKARRWLDVPANEAQLPYAITMLGLSYWEENLSSSDHRKALELFGKALELGDADAHIYFGWMTATGLGRSEHRESGIRYIETGQTLGAEGAAEMLNRLADMGTTVTVPYAGYEGCEIEFVTGEAYRAWRWAARQLKLVWTQEPEMDQFLCEQTENLPVSVTEYLGKTENEPAYYFAVTFDDCNMKFEVTRNDEGFHHKTTYDQTCHRYVPPTPPPSPGTSYASRSDYYNTCLGMTQYETNCYSVDDPDLKNLCLANSGQGYETNCYSIQDEDVKNLCLAVSVPSYSTNCYSIDNEDIKNTCLAASANNFTTNCYSIDSEPWRSMCGGLALSQNNCYNLN